MLYNNAEQDMPPANNAPWLLASLAASAAAAASFAAMAMFVKAPPIVEVSVVTNSTLVRMKAA